MALPVIKKIALVSLALHILAAIFSTGFHHFDEHFQVLEFLNFRVGNMNSSTLPWEFTSMVRPWFQVSLYACLYNLFSFIGISSPFIHTFIFRLVTALFGWAALCSLWPLICDWIKDQKYRSLTWGLIHLAWFVPYIQARTSGESLGSSFLILALCGFLLFKDWKHHLIKKGFLIGVCFGAAYSARYQIALMVAFLWFWEIFIGERKWRLLLSSALGILFMIGMGVVFDHWGYGQWTFAPWNLLYADFFEGILKATGVTPWWEFLRLSFNRGIPPISLILMLATLHFWIVNWRHPLTWAMLPLFVFHSIIGHKELRYIFPLIMLTPLLLGVYIYQYREKFENLWNSKRFRYPIKFTVTLNLILLLASSLKPANPSANFYRYLHNHPEINQMSFPKDNSPFQMVGLDIMYYRPKGLLLSEYSSLENANSKYIFTHRGKLLFEMERRKNCQNIYMTYPRFLLNFNIGNWISRSRVWAIFKCQL